MAKLKLLYVDDEFVNLQLFKYNFHKLFELYLASSGQEALEIIKKEPISIIISDLKMPGMNGIELIDRIIEQFPKKVCFMLSAYSVAEAVDMGLDEAKIMKYITKPWNRDSVIRDVNDVVLN